MKTRYLPLFGLLLAGCVKEPGPGIPPAPVKPPYLIRSVTLIEKTGYTDPLPGEPNLYLHKQVFEFRYNDRYRPVSRITYDAAGDTLNLRQQVLDTMIYDSRDRVVQVDSYISTQASVRERRKFSYPGNDTLPGTMEVWYSSYPNRDSLYLSGSTNFLYKPDTALAISQNYHGGLDTMAYIYENGNFTRLYATTGYEENIYTSYDHVPAIEHSMNLSHGMVFRMPMDYVVPPVLSRNNWMGEGPQTRTKNITYSGNLVSGYVVTEYYAVPTYWTFRIAYFSP